MESKTTTEYQATWREKPTSDGDRGDIRLVITDHKLVRIDIEEVIDTVGLRTIEEAEKLRDALNEMIKLAKEVDDGSQE